ncbi:putative ABC transport system permease protein [Frigoribacterium sp. PhB107]|uniref:ABC transporter permease n=1 Tax=Frigoribacterium sp. PhB107 TaxID=2485172 RepID=UPI000F4755AA|nr:ABC transporter permease [Frigoribacterium sp. PhB107]ROP75243.1 putative ABC transport system permease protein [Frigoribacterium sp. PhB107]
MTDPTASRLLPADVLRLGASGLLTRPTRALLSALGIAIGIAAMIAVVGISTSSQARLAAQLDTLGTNLLEASQGQDLFGEKTPLPLTTLGSAARVDGVESVASTGLVADTGVYRSAAVPEGETGGIAVRTASSGLLDVLGTDLAAGIWFTDGTASYPTVVLGSAAAEALGVSRPGQHVLVGKTEHLVIGVLEPSPLASDVDRSALIGERDAEVLTGAAVPPSAVYLRVDDERVDEVRELIAPTIRPDAPSEVSVARPSDALAARQAADQAFTGLLVGLGSVALLVGGIGVANTMVISVLERRREIGLRRALGATKAHVRDQFLAEALLLSLLGGVGGIVLGLAVTAVFAASRGWPLAVPPAVLGAGLGATLLIGAIAGLWPAVRAARTPRTEALQS